MSNPLSGEPYKVPVFEFPHSLLLTGRNSNNSANNHTKKFEIRRVLSPFIVQSVNINVWYVRSPKRTWYAKLPYYFTPHYTYLITFGCRTIGNITSDYFCLFFFFLLFSYNHISYFCLKGITVLLE